MISDSPPIIRASATDDTVRLAQIWLQTNLAAHHFIAADYWHAQFDAVRAQLAQAEIYVYEKDRRILGFAGLNNGHIEGLFVCPNAQSQGIGKALLDCLKQQKSCLQLHVYRQNHRAVRFYLREGFAVVRESVDADTGEKEYAMAWQKNICPPAA